MSVFGRIIELETLVTVYGFHNDKMTLRKTCHVFMQLYEGDDGNVAMDWETTPISGDECLHRDSLERQRLEEEKD